MKPLNMNFYLTLGRRLSWLVLVPVMLISISRNAAADHLTAFFETNAAMQGNFEEDLMLLQVNEGVITAPVTFTSQLNANTMSYSYSMVSGSVYNGQPATLTASGSFDSLTGQWTSTTSTRVGVDSWSTTGATTFTGSLDKAVVVGEEGLSSGLQPDKTWSKSKVTWFWNPASNRWESVGEITTVDKEGHIHIETEINDSEHDPEKFLDHITEEGMQIRGQYNFNTGLGTLVVSPVPEPTSLFLLGSGILGLGGFFRKRLLKRR